MKPQKHRWHGHVNWMEEITVKNDDMGTQWAQTKGTVRR